jgi:multidrug efflux pump subunit AcrA (membrane-fusion protein)
MDISHFSTQNTSRVKRLWRRYVALTMWKRVAIAGGLFVLLLVVLTVLRSGKAADTGDTLPSVSLVSVGALSGGATGANFVGSVRSESQADIVAQSSGTVTSVNASVGQSVGAGTILAELENASQRAAVLQAQGSYDAAVAARGAVSPVDSKLAAVNAYDSAYSTLDTDLSNYVDTFFGLSTSYGPELLIAAPTFDYGELSKERQSITNEMVAYHSSLATASAGDPSALLTSAATVTAHVSTLINNLATAANDSRSTATAAQLTALATARASVNALSATLASALQSYRSASVTSTASVDASVTIALGGLHAAEANLEKTRIRAPIAGTVNFLPLHVGDYVTANQRVATVAQNGALEIISFVSEDVRNQLKVGQKVVVSGSSSGVITSIAPALDPVTKQIEVHVAVDAASGLTNGQSVGLSLAAPAQTVVTTATTTPAAGALLPLASVKLGPSERDLFTVGSDGRLVALPVEVGDVVGDRISITTPLDPSLLIVSDARGLSNGEKVLVASSTPS